MNAHHRLFMLIAATTLLPPALLGQGLDIGGRSTINELDRYNLLQSRWIVAGKVTTMRGDPILGARVVVFPINASGEFRSLVTSLQGEFQTEYVLSPNLVKELRVELRVTKKGFRKATAVVNLGSPQKPIVIPITLREPNQDPSLLSQTDLISTLAPRLKQFGASGGLSAKSERDYERGVEEFLDRNHPDRSLEHLTKVIDRDPTCTNCRTMLGLARLDSGDWDGAVRECGEAVKQGRDNPQVGRAEPALVLGIMESWKHEYERATGFLAEALRYSPRDPLALQEIGRVDLLLQNWQTAASYLAKALEAGADPEARLLRAQALLGIANSKEANQEMTRLLNGRDVKTMPLHVRLVWTQIEERKKIEATYAKVKSDVDQPLDYLRGRTPELKDLEPVADQGPLNEVLSAVGKNVFEFFRNFPNTSSLEEIHQEKLKRNGKVEGTKVQKFHYLCVLSGEAGGLGFNEYRADLAGNLCTPSGLPEGFMLTSGFASASLFFHPLYQSQATFRYLGRQKIDGRNTHVIAFAQKPTEARLCGSFKWGDLKMTTFSQGLAWVDAENGQILRLRTDLLTPLPEVQLERQTTEIDFSEVHFSHLAQAFWSPREVAVTVTWHGKHLRNLHHYSDFKLFNVETKEKMGNPKQAAFTATESSKTE